MRNKENTKLMLLANGENIFYNCQIQPWRKLLIEQQPPNNNFSPELIIAILVALVYYKIGLLYYQDK